MIHKRQEEMDSLSAFDSINSDAWRMLGMEHSLATSLICI